MRICVIFNPKARGEKASKLQKLLQKVSGDCDLKPTTCAGDGRRLAMEAVQQGYETVVAAGGDGTLNEVLNGIAEAEEGFRKVRLGVLPLGTVNVFARELKIPRRLEGAWEVITRGNEISVDVPRVEYAARGSREVRYFVQLAGAGLDSRAIDLVSWDLKKKVGPVAYIAAGFKAMAGKQSKIVVEAEGMTLTGEMVLLGNGRLYGGDFVLFPGADLRDGELEVCVFPKIDWQVLARAGIGLTTNRLHQLCNVQQVRAKTVKLSSIDQTYVELDGENVGELPATFSVLPKALRVLVPAS